jgi:hypothetical protein
MIVSIPRLIGAAAAGAVVAMASLGAVFASRPALTLQMDHERLPMLSGFYEPERDGDTTFAWTRGRADIALADVNRQQPWRCTVRLRGARPPGVPQPAVDLAVDGVTVSTVTATNDYQDANVVIPASPTPGARLTIASAPTFKAPPDPREFGVQVDSVTCRPAGSTLAWPAPSAMRAAAIAGAIWGAAIALAGLGAGAALGLAAVVAIAQALPLAAGTAPYTGYAGRAPWLTLWIGLGVVTAVHAIRLGRKASLSPAGTFAVVLSGAILYLKLLALLHPGKLLQDALFNVHNLSKVLSGTLFFVQPMPGNVQFPYAIALYVFAAPWSVFTHSEMDRVALLRIVVCAADVVAGACLYWMIVRAWGDRIAGILAVVLYQLLPLSFGMQGNGNLVNCFGQSVAVVAMALVTNWSLEPRRLAQLTGLTVVIAAAFLAHVSVVSSLLATLLVLTVLYWRTGPPLRQQSRVIITATFLALLLAAGLYYGRWDHFGDAYRSLQRTTSAAAPTTAPTAGVLQLQTSSRPVLGLKQIASDLGWPILALALFGVWRLWARRGVDRLVLAVAAWEIAFTVYFAFGVLAPTSEWYLRYTLEFISRANYAAAPAAVILAGAAGSWAWRAGLAPRIAAAGLVLWAAASGVSSWSGWFQ